MRETLLQVRQSLRGLYLNVVQYEQLEMNIYFCVWIWLRWCENRNFYGPQVSAEQESRDVPALSLVQRKIKTLRIDTASVSWNLDHGDIGECRRA